MNRQEKQLVVDVLKNEFADSKAAFLVGVQGLSVEQMHLLRKELYKQGSELKVAKNTLLKIATQDVPSMQKLSPYFKQQVGVVFAKNDFAAVAKILCDKAKENSKLQLITSCVDADLMDIKVLAALGSREMQVARLCGLLKTNIARLAVVLKAVSERPQ